MKTVAALHPCSELPPKGPILNHETNKLSWVLHRDAGALEYLQKRFAASKAFAGKGKFGSVVALADVELERRASLAVKILPFRIDDNERYDPLLLMRDVQQELYIACQVNELSDWTPAFIKTFGWLVSAKIPRAWKPYVNLDELQYADAKKRSFMFIFMEQSTYPFDSEHVKFDLKGYLQIIFILLHALHVAKSQIGFNHSDLHMGNIMLDVTRNSGIVLKMDEETAFEMELPNFYMPKIIDFGNAKTDKAQDGGKNFNDISSLFAAVIKRATKYDPKLDIGPIFNFTDFNWSLHDLLMKHSIFDSIRKYAVPNKRLKVGNKCSMCGAEAKLKYEFMDNYMFCHSFCASKVEGLVVLMEK